VQAYADAGDEKSAVAALDRLEELKRAGSPGFKTVLPEKIDYARGNLLFWYREYAPAIENLKRASAAAKELDPNTGSLSFLRLGQCYDMTGRRSDAVAAYRATVAYAPDSDAAREARRYLSAPYHRSI